VPVIDARLADAAAARDGAKHRAVRDPAKRQPRLEGNNRTGEVARAAAHLDLAPTGLFANDDQQALVLDRDPARVIFDVIGSAIEADDLAAAQTPGETDKQDGAVA
jgi:hypothetical protein